jgi:hypothetical protein
MQYLHSMLASTGATQTESSISVINVLINTSLATDGRAASSATMQSVASDGVIIHVVHANLHT